MSATGSATTAFLETTAFSEEGRRLQPRPGQKRRGVDRTGRLLPLSPHANKTGCKTASNCVRAFGLVYSTASYFRPCMNRRAHLGVYNVSNALYTLFQRKSKKPVRAPSLRNWVRSAIKVIISVPQTSLNYVSELRASIFRHGCKRHAKVNHSNPQDERAALRTLVADRGAQIKNVKSQCEQTKLQPLFFPWGGRSRSNKARHNGDCDLP